MQLDKVQAAQGLEQFRRERLPMLHTDARGRCTPMVGTDPGVTSEAGMDVVSCGLDAQVGVEVTTR